MPKAKTTTSAPVVPAAPADNFSPAMKLERLSVREKVKAALMLPKEAITSREAGHIDLVVSPSMFSPAALTSALKAACSSNGIQCQITQEATEVNGVVTLTFTNALMIKQALWGARGNNRQGRVLSAAPAPVVAPVAPVAPVVKEKAKQGKGKKAAR